MKFKCNWCETLIVPPRPHVDAVDQNFSCRTCGGRYKQVVIRQIETREGPK